jgi:uncharacterized repeat protein (TIGR01451 family)
MLLLLFVLGLRTAHAQMTITPSTWNVVGLDSNNVNVGPDTFLIGARVRNTGGATITNIVGTFTWDSSNIYINLVNATTVNVASLAPGASHEIFFNVRITRTSAAYNATRRYHITVSANNAATVSTPTPREVYVEKLVSQNRNSTQNVSGPTTLVVGQTYNFVVDASTATGGYEQLVDELTFPNNIFLVQSVSSTYTAPTGATNNSIYADACGWENNPLSTSYRSCIGPENFLGGKAGGTIRTTYTVKIIGSGSAQMDSIIYDYSGSSYHYGNDSVFLAATAYLPPNIDLVKSVSPSGTVLPGSDLAYTINFSNSGQLPALNFILIDPVPANTDFKVGSVTSALGTTGLTVTISYSNNGGVSYAYTPASGAGGAPTGYDRNVTHVRWSFSGNLSGNSPNNAGSVGFTARIR